MLDFVSNPYRGPQGVPHIPKEAFIPVFVGVHAGFKLARHNGYFGTEVMPRKYNPDYVMNVAAESLNRNRMRRGQHPVQVYMGAPRDTDYSHEKRWFTHYHHQRWIQERMGPWNTPVRFYG